MPLSITIPNYTLWSNRLKNPLNYSKNNKWIKSVSLVPILQLQITNQDRTWQDSAYIVKEMDTTSCTAELKPMMIRSKDSRLELIKSAEQFSLLTITKEADRILGLRTLKFLFSNPDKGIRIIKNPIAKMASTQIGTETQIDSNAQIDQTTHEPTEHTTGNKLSITSTLNMKPLILNTTKIFHRVTTYLNPTQFNLLTIRNKMQWTPYQV